MNRYFSFGYLIESDIPLPELSEADASDVRQPDLRIIRKDIGRTIPPPTASPIFDYNDPEGVVMIWPTVAGFRIRLPDVIEIWPAESAKPEYLAFPLLGPVMGWFLHLRGKMILHGSAVAMDGTAFAFLGDKMAGKSTTAAAFLRGGASLLTDDLLIFDMDAPSDPIVRPAFAQLKLSDDAAAAISVPGATPLPLIMDGFAKRQHKLDRMVAGSMTCDAIFVLERSGDNPSVIWMNEIDALTSLMRFSYNVRFANAPLDMQDRGRHFEHCAALAKSCRVGTLKIPANLSRLDETVDFVRGTLSATES